MTISKLFAAVAAAVIGFGTLAATTAPAAADSAYFGFQVGGHRSPTIQFGFSTGYPAPVYRPVYPAYPRYEPVYQYRPVRVPVCNDVWRVRNVYDRYGRLVKVVKVRDQECHYRRY
jgi:hypothetical protein